MASNEMKTPNETLHTASDYADVLAACRAGDRAGRRRLYELCHLRVYRLMVRIVGLQDAPDLTQQIFLQLFLKIDQFRGHARFETWLYRLAVNEALQHLRRGRRAKLQPMTYEPTAPDHREQEREEHNELLERALAKVEPGLRSLFVLREVDGLSYREIADVMEIPEGTVGSRLNRARRELQQHLRDLGWEA